MIKGVFFQQVEEVPKMRRAEGALVHSCQSNWSWRVFEGEEVNSEVVLKFVFESGGTKEATLRVEEKDRRMVKMEMSDAELKEFTHSTKPFLHMWCAVFFAIKR